MELSVVVPCHNEEESIMPLVTALTETLNGLVVGYEIILVDDGSQDQTSKIIDEARAADPRVRGLIFSRNFGKESAMLAGLEDARGEYVLIMDADLQHPVELVPEMLEIIRQGQVDQVIAKRDRSGEGFLRRNVSRLYYKGLNQFVDVHIGDGSGDFRILTRRAVDALLLLQESNRFSKGLFSWIGFPTETIEYRNVPRSYGKSSWSFRNLVNYGIDGIVSFNSKPLRLALYVGAFSALGGLIYLAILLVQYFVQGVSTPGYFTTTGLIIFFGGLQLLMLGIVGEYVGRLYLEAKKRPQYVIMDRLESEQQPEATDSSRERSRAGRSPDAGPLP